MKYCSCDPKGKDLCDWCRGAADDVLGADDD